MNQLLPKPFTAPPLFLATLGLPTEPVRKPKTPQDSMAIYQDYQWGNLHTQAIETGRSAIRHWEKRT